MTSHRLRVVTNSELSTFRRCPKEHYYAYELGFRPTKAPSALVIGTAWHKGLELWWSGHSLQDAMSAASDMVDDRYEAAALRSMLRVYDSKWDRPSDSRVLAEPQFSVELDGFILAGKIDVLLDDCFVEHKTASGDVHSWSDYWEALKLDSQIAAYFLGSKELSVDSPRYCMYDVVKKPGASPRQVPVIEDGAKLVIDGDGNRVRTKDGKKWRETANSKSGYSLVTREETVEEFEQRTFHELTDKRDEYFVRRNVSMTEENIQSFVADAKQTIRMIELCASTGSYPKSPGACRRFGRMCPYFMVCCEEASLSNTSMFEKVDSVHRELEEV